ncbi:phiSA1p31-related protein [Streptomyces sp. NBC_01456]|uniref:phiSA1p31-related protein n=1 Tax=Streptomyces sp. NBC_01456 TaxID=2975868 RepID=UPI002E36FBF9|nr:phiSA1p31-related protein [Streptomyces sp. NBC_01456]
MTRAALLRAAATNQNLRATDRAQLLWAAREFTELDGTEYDLSLTWIDVRGCPWQWTGRHGADGMPIMRSPLAMMPLDEVYATWAPLIPAPRRPIAADVRAALRGAA